jgi:predicted transcriptional regulator of viral defense system
MKPVTERKVLKLVQKVGLLRPRDLDAHGIPRKYLNQLYHRGLLRRVARGLYTSSTAQATENRTLAEVSKQIPGGVVCLLSALRLHDLTTQNPFQVWLAIDRKAWRPRVTHLPVRFVRYSTPALTSGVEERTIEGVCVKVTTPARTVADCFKYRNKIGLDVAIEALRDCRRSRTCTMDELWQAAKTCRVANVMRPYMESMT